MDINISGFGLLERNSEQIQRKIEDNSFAKRLQKAYSEGDHKKLKEACEDFEAIFMKILYRQMKATIPRSDLIPEAPGRDIFEDMLDDKMIDRAKERGIGISRMLYKQLEKQIDNIYSVKR